MAKTSQAQANSGPSAQNIVAKEREGCGDCKPGPKCAQCAAQKLRDPPPADPLNLDDLLGPDNPTTSDRESPVKLEETTPETEIDDKTKAQGLKGETTESVTIGATQKTAVPTKGLPTSPPGGGANNRSTTTNQVVTPPASNKAIPQAIQNAAFQAFNNIIARVIPSDSRLNAFLGKIAVAAGFKSNDAPNAREENFNLKETASSSSSKKVEKKAEERRPTGMKEASSSIDKPQSGSKELSTSTNLKSLEAKYEDRGTAVKNSDIKPVAVKDRDSETLNGHPQSSNTKIAVAEKASEAYGNKVVVSPVFFAGGREQRNSPEAVSESQLGLKIKSAESVRTATSSTENIGDIRHKPRSASSIDAQQHSDRRVPLLSTESTVPRIQLGRSVENSHKTDKSVGIKAHPDNIEKSEARSARLNEIKIAATNEAGKVDSNRQIRNYKELITGTGKNLKR